MVSRKLAVSPNSRANEIHKVRKHLEISVEKSIESKRPIILLLGPKIDGDDDASALRRQLKELIWGMGVPVFAEHDEMLEVAATKLQDLSNLTRLELHIARKANLIVLIPASPGSFAELGLFAQQDAICPRLIVLFDKRFRENGESYILSGPRKAARERKAETPFVNYRDIDSVWKRIRQSIRRAQAQMADIG